MAEQPPESPGNVLGDHSSVLNVLSLGALVQAGISLLKSNVSSKYIAMRQMFILFQESSGHSDQAWQEMSPQQEDVAHTVSEMRGLSPAWFGMELCTLVSSGLRALKVSGPARRLQSQPQNME